MIVKAAVAFDIKINNLHTSSIENAPKQHIDLNTKKYRSCCSKKAIFSHRLVAGLAITRLPIPDDDRFRGVAFVKKYINSHH